MFQRQRNMFVLADTDTHTHMQDEEIEMKFSLLLMFSIYYSRRRTFRLLLLFFFDWPRVSFVVKQHHQLSSRDHYWLIPLLFFSWLYHTIVNRVSYGYLHGWQDVLYEKKEVFFSLSLACSLSASIVQHIHDLFGCNSACLTQARYYLLCDVQTGAIGIIY